MCIILPSKKIPVIVCIILITLESQKRLLFFIQNGRYIYLSHVLTLSLFIKYKCMFNMSSVDRVVRRMTMSPTIPMRLQWRLNGNMQLMLLNHCGSRSLLFTGFVPCSAKVIFRMHSIQHLVVAW